MDKFLFPYQLYKQFWEFVKNPDYKPENLTDKQKVINIFWLLIPKFLIAIFVLLLHQIIELWYVFPESKIKEINWIIIFSAIVIAPVVEELIFRNPLNSPKYSFGFSGLFLIVFLGQLLLFIKIISPLFIFSTAIIWLISWNFFNLKVKHKLFWKKNYKWFFYWFVICFGSIHLMNYEIEKSSVFILPILILSQTIGGIFFGFVRIKYGLRYSILMHSLFNFMVTIPYFLTTLFEMLFSSN